MVLPHTLTDDQIAIIDARFPSAGRDVYQRFVFDNRAAFVALERFYQQPLSANGSIRISTDKEQLVLIMDLIRESGMSFDEEKFGGSSDARWITIHHPSGPKMSIRIDLG